MAGTRPHPRAAVLIVSAVAGLSVSMLVGFALVAPGSGRPAVEALTSAPLPGVISPHEPAAPAPRAGGRATVAIPIQRVSTSRPAPPLRTAGSFFLAELRRKLRGDWAGSWRHLHPAHQRVAPIDTFVPCEIATPFPAAMESIRITKVRGAPFGIPGQRSVVWSAAVTVAVELQWYGPRDPIVLEPTFHLVPVEGRWTWLLSDDRYRLYSRGGCVSGSTVELDAATTTIG